MNEWWSPWPHITTTAVYIVPELLHLSLAEPLLAEPGAQEQIMILYIYVLAFLLSVVDRFTYTLLFATTSILCIIILYYDLGDPGNEARFLYPGSLTSSITGVRGLDLLRYSASSLVLQGCISMANHSAESHQPGIAH